MRTPYAQHPLSAAFPPMSPEEFEALVADISANGQQEAIVLFEGKVLDGWNRQAACVQAGREPITTPLPQGVNPVQFVMSRNLHRRHLSASQRALAVAACASWRPVGRPANTATVAALHAPSTVAEAAEEAGVGVRTMERAKKVVKDAAAEVIEAVRTGSMTVDKAADIAALPKEEQAEAVATPAAKPAKAKAPKADAASAEEVADLRAQLAEMARNLEDTLADNQAMAAVFEADDKLAEAMKEITKLRAQVSTLTERNNGLMAEKNAAIRQAKAAQKKLAAAGVDA